MRMFNKDELLTLADGKEYCVVDEYTDKGIVYIYLVDINDNTNVIFGKLENDEVVEITNEKELEKMIKLVSEHLHKN